MSVGVRRVSVERLNRQSAVAFADEMAPFFEGGPGFLARLAEARPFDDARDLFQRAGIIVASMPDEDRIQLINAHPRIGAAPGSLSAASLTEQGADVGAPGLQAELDRLNSAYEARFGFRLVVFVAGRPRSEIVPLMRARLLADRAAEMRAAVADVVAIAEDRWRKAEVMNP